ncbi:cell recognition protein [Psittacine orthoreovirus SRK/Germany/2007]|uniref:Cell recognition protein n=1 Tax=Psittacine orthoreovirus SRK/Germany/2007 TaxID=529100 RepID=B6RMV5_9REOV|nr:cell recognition protein [Psittacine orthoreovirus SRK/Germany/2007]
MDGLNQSQRREVVGLILSLTSNTNSNSGDLGPIYDRLTALETRQLDADQTLTSLSDALSSISSDLSEVLSALGDLTAQLTSMTLKLTSIDSSVSAHSKAIDDLRQSMTANTSAIAHVTSAVSAMSPRLDSVISDVSQHSLTLVDLVNRVSALEKGGSSDLVFSAPLQLQDKVVSLQLDPYFASSSPALTNYSTNAVLMMFQWLARADSGGVVTMNANAHAHGCRTDVLMSTLQPLTVAATSVTVTMNLDYIIDKPSDLSRLTPSRAFQGSSFPVEITYQRDGKLYTFQVYGTFTEPTSFKFSFVTSGTGAGNLTYLTVKYGIDT